MRYDYFGEALDYSLSAKEQSNHIECIGRAKFDGDLSFEDIIHICDEISSNEKMWEKSTIPFTMDERLSYVRNAFIKGFQSEDRKGIISFMHGSILIDLREIKHGIVFHSAIFDLPL